MECCSPRTGQKKRFKTEAQAWEAANRVTKRSGNQMRAYQCRWCGYWHIGWDGPKERKAISMRTFPLINVCEQAGTLLRKDGTKWTVDFKHEIYDKKIQERIDAGYEYTADVIFYERGSPKIVDFMELSKNDEMSLEEQRKWAEIEGGDY